MTDANTGEEAAAAETGQSNEPPAPGPDGDEEKEHGGGRSKEEEEYERQKHEKTCGCCPRVIAGDIGLPCAGKTISYYINPVVMGFAIIFIWGFVIYAAVGGADAKKTFAEAQKLIVKEFTWLYVGTLSIFLMFAFYLIFSKYGDIKLGPKDEPPRYSLGAWFSMLFSAGVGVGLYFFGVAEPVFYIGELQGGSSRWYNNQFNRQGMDSINLAWFHWGLSASATYVIAGLPLAYHHHAQGEPMRESVCFMELLGKKYVNAAIGNVIDLCSVIGTMFGIGTSLGLGALQVNAGLKFVFGVEEGLPAQMFIIWGITLCATISVLSGVDKGIKLLSQAFISLSCLLMLYIFIAGDTIFYLNLLIQGIGYHLTWLLELQFSTQAFEQAGFYDKPDSVALSSVASQQGWMGSWTIFYWAWWIAWAPFVGIFLANISRGRTVREFVIGNMLVPTIITCVWFSIIGGWGLYNEMAAIQKDMQCLGPVDARYSEIKDFNGHNIIKLSCYPTATMLFAALTTLPFAKFSAVIVIISIILGFVTSSDSASMVIDILTASGNEFPPKLQRLFWALTEGAVATALLAAGGSDALTALQTASLVGALPLVIILLFELLATLKSFKKHYGEIIEDELTYWKKDIFESVNILNIKFLFEATIFLFCPPIIQTKTLVEYNKKAGKSPILSIILQWIVYLAILVLIIVGGSVTDKMTKKGCFDYAWTLYFGFIFVSIKNRRAYKEMSNINSSNLLYDAMAWIVCPCLAGIQEYSEFDPTISNENNDDNKQMELVTTETNANNNDNNSEQQKEQPATTNEVFHE